MLRRLWNLISRWLLVFVGVGVIATHLYLLWLDPWGHDKWGPGFATGFCFEMVYIEIIKNIKG